MTKRPGFETRHVSAEDATRLYQAWARLGLAMMERPVGLSRTAVERLAGAAVRGLVGPWAPQRLAQTAGREGLDFATGLMATPAEAAAAAVETLDAPRPPVPEVLEKVLCASAPAPLGGAVTVRPGIAIEQIRALAEAAGTTRGDEDMARVRAGVADRIVLPARIVDSSQGWASWFVPGETAEALMREAVELGHQPPEVLEMFEPVIVGRGAAMVTLMATDYRTSDFGKLTEIGLTLTVTPRGGGFPDPGQMFLRLIVDDPLSLAVARRVWGIRKDYWDTHEGPRIDVAYSADSVRFGSALIRAPEAVRGDVLAMTFPRFGRGRSQDMRSGIYSMRERGPELGGPCEPVRATLCRTNEREGTQYGGKVELELPQSKALGSGGGCLCSEGMACLCETLRGIGLDRRRPAANGWTDRMTGTLAAPEPVSPAYSPGK